MEREKILEINNMKISFTQYQKGMQQTELPVIKDLSVTIHAGEMVAVVGSSGSGKSLLAHGIMGILPYNAEMGGEIRYCGEPLTEKNIRKLRGKEIVLVPQSTSYLDPLMKVGQQICKGKKNKEKKKHLDSIFEQYSLDKKVQEQYPFELSGGMTRRIMISTALIENPKLVRHPGWIRNSQNEQWNIFVSLRIWELLFLSLHMIWNLPWKRQTEYRYFMPVIQSKMRQWMILMRKKLLGIHIPEHSGVRCRSTVFDILTGYSLM